MRGCTLVLSLCALLLSGCDFVRMLLPRHSTAAAEARSALERCGIDPDSIAWQVGPDGTFAFGRKSADASPMTEPQTKCLMRWVEDNRIKEAFIGWDAAPH